MKTLFLKSNILHIRTNEGEFEVSNPEVIPSKMKNYADAPEGLFSPVEWPYGVELNWRIATSTARDTKYTTCTEEYAKSNPGFHSYAIARLIPEEKKAAYEEECQHPACNCGKMIEPFNKECPKCRTKDFASCHSMHCPVRKPVESSEPQEKGEYYGDCCPLCGHVVHPVKIGYLIRWYCENGDCLNCNPVKMHSVVESVSAPSESQEEVNVVLSDLTAFQNTLHESGLVTFRNLRGDIISVKGMIQHITKLLTRKPE